MVSAVAITLTSSPPRQFRCPAFGMASSPVLASPKEIVRNRPHLLPSGKCAAPIPKDAILTFTSAATLLRLPRTESSATSPSVPDAAGGDDFFYIESVLDMEPVQKGTEPLSTNITLARDRDIDVTGVTGATEVKKVRKPPKKKAEPEELEGKPNDKPSRKSRSRKADTTNLEEDGNFAEPIRKPRAKKRETEKQTKLPKGRVGKATVTSKKANTKESREQPEFVEQCLAESKKGNPAKDVDLGLAPAAARKREWTPPPTTSNNLAHETPLSLNTTDELGHDISSSNKANSFQDLFENFGYVRNNTSAADNNPTDIIPVGKRKLSELIVTNSAASKISSEAKSKPPPKKIKTITGQATAAYRVEYNNSSQAKLPGYLPSDSKVANDKSKPPSKRSRSAVKSTPRAKSSKPKKGTAAAPIVLSPESALKQACRQDFVFGTSSQLAREDSPTLLRDLHAAMQASNAVDDDSLGDFLYESDSVQVATKKARSSLWSAATRDSTGELLGIETVDLVNTPEPEDKSEITATVGRKLNMVPGDEIWDDVELVETPFISCSSSLKTDAPENGSLGAYVVDDLKSSRSESNGQDTVSSQNGLEKSIASQSSKVVTQHPTATGTSNPTTSNMPNYASYTTTQLAKEIASYRFKAVKSRDQMIALLERCWESKQRTALQNLGTNTLTGTSAREEGNLEHLKPSTKSVPRGTTSPKRPRGRPRKVIQPTIIKIQRTPKKRTSPDKVTVDNDEIYDPEPVTPSPPRRKLTEMGTPPQSLPLSMQKDLEVCSKLSGEALQKELFAHITRAIRDAPRSKDPLNPNWHEKILLYDPIILEDLATWLNTGALQKVGWDGEVAPTEVKKWCES
ncbi:hypothetical protein B7463_g3614, partial [Scytalidium lignicola]